MKVKFLIFILFSVACFAQQKGDVTLTWVDKSEISFGTYKVNVPQFKSENFTFWFKEIIHNFEDKIKL